ncbi:hypothetical protein Tco_0122888 [Tanacetum coccineum]
MEHVDGNNKPYLSLIMIFWTGLAIHDVHLTEKFLDCKDESPYGKLHGIGLEIADHVRQDSDRVAEVTAAIRCISFCDDKRQKRSSVRRETFETWPQTGMRCLEGHKAHISFLQDICPACVLMICAISPSNIAPRSLGMSLDVLSGVYSNVCVFVSLFGC